MPTTPISNDSNEQENLEKNIFRLNLFNNPHSRDLSRNSIN